MSDSSVTPETIRPVEVLWLRTHYEDASGWNRENAVQAVLMDLSIRELLEPEEDNETFEPTEKGENANDLRDYEEEILEAIEGEDDQERMVAAVYDYDFEGFFKEESMLKDVQKSEERGLPLIPNSWYSYTASWVETKKTDKYRYIMGEKVTEHKQELEASIREKKVSADMLPMLLAYPNASFMEGVDLEQADEFVVDGETVTEMGSTVDATDTAVMAAASAGACAAASSACASSAASACAAGGAAGAAGGAGGV